METRGPTHPPEPLSLFIAATFSRGSSSDQGDSVGAIRGGGDLSSNEGEEVCPAGAMGWDVEVSEISFGRDRPRAT